MCSCVCFYVAYKDTTSCRRREGKFYVSDILFILLKRREANSKSKHRWYQELGLLQTNRNQRVAFFFTLEKMLDDLDTLTIYQDFNPFRVKNIIINYLWVKFPYFSSNDIVINSCAMHARCALKRFENMSIVILFMWFIFCDMVHVIRHIILVSVWNEYVWHEITIIISESSKSTCVHHQVIIPTYTSW